MKKINFIFAFAIFISMVLNTISYTYAQQVDLSVLKNVTMALNENFSIEIVRIDQPKETGCYPQITSSSYKQINSQIIQSYSDMKNLHKNASSFYSTFEVKGYGKYKSIVMSVDVTVNNEIINYVKTLNVDTEKGKIVNLNDLFGSNYITDISTQISLIIDSQDEADFYHDEKAFAKISEEQNFYILNDHAHIIFDKGSIAPASSGVPVFQIPLTDSFSSNEKVSVTMSPLLDTRISGAYPSFETSGYDDLQSLIYSANALIVNEVSNNHSYVTYETKQYANFFTIIMKYELTDLDSNLKKVITYTVDTNTKQLVSLVRFLGENFVDEIKNAVSVQIAKDPNMYFDSKEWLNSITEWQDYYLEGNNAVVMFDAGIISSVSNGVISFKVPLPESRDNQIFEIADKRIYDIKQNVVGNLPIIKADGYDKINALIEDAYNETVMEYSGKSTLNAAYMVKGYDKYRTIILDFYESSDNSGFEKIYTFNIDTLSKELVYLKDCFGDSYPNVVNNEIKRQIKLSEEGRFYKGENGFKSVTPEQTFYLEGGSAFILFNKYEIAAGFVGIPVFEIPLILDDVDNAGIDVAITLSPIKIKHYNGVLYAPLRQTAEALGYDVYWDMQNRVSSAVKGNRVASAFDGQNTYLLNDKFLYELEDASFISAGKAQVPLSFFEQLLRLVVTINSDGGVTISTM